MGALAVIDRPVHLIDQTSLQVGNMMKRILPAKGVA